MAEIRVELIKSQCTEQKDNPHPFRAEREIDAAPNWAAASVLTVEPHTVIHE